MTLGPQWWSVDSGVSNPKTSEPLPISAAEYFKLENFFLISSFTTFL